MPPTGHDYWKDPDVIEGVANRYPDMDMRPYGVGPPKAVGWFVTHSAWNSTMESILARLAKIACPLAPCDQSINAAWVSTRRKPIGFELCQVSVTVTLAERLESWINGS